MAVAQVRPILLSGYGVQFDIVVASEHYATSRKLSRSTLFDLLFAGAYVAATPNGSIFKQSTVVGDF